MAFDRKKVPANVLQEMLSGRIGDSLGWRIRMAPSEWIVDDETGNFLYATYWGDEDNRTSSAYVFSWQHELIFFAVETNEKFLEGIKAPLTTELTVKTALPLSDRAEGCRARIEEEIAEALERRHSYCSNIIVNFAPTVAPKLPRTNNVAADIQATEPHRIPHQYPVPRLAADREIQRNRGLKIGKSRLWATLVVSLMFVLIGLSIAVTGGAFATAVGTILLFGACAARVIWLLLRS